MFCGRKKSGEWLGKYINMVAKKGYWDNISYIYDVFISLYLRQAYERGTQKVLAYIKGDDMVLDVATGSGSLTQRISQISSHVCAIDLSETMLRRAKEKANSSGLFCMDAESLGFKNDSFDKVICFNGLHVFENPLFALMEMKRVLKPEGSILTATFCYGDLRAWVFKLFLLYSGWLWLAGGIPPFLHQFSISYLLDLFKKAGLKVIFYETIYNFPPLLFIHAIY